jgi:hypothetical protein
VSIDRVKSTDGLYGNHERACRRTTSSAHSTVDVFMDLRGRCDALGGTAAGWLNPLAAAQLAAVGTLTRNGPGQLPAVPRRPWPARISSRHRHERSTEAGCGARIAKLQPPLAACGEAPQRTPQLVSEAAEARVGMYTCNAHQHVQTCSSAGTDRTNGSTAGSNCQSSTPDPIQWPGPQPELTSSVTWRQSNICSDFNHALC